MKAITCRRYGPPDVLRLEEIPVPSIGKTDLLIRVRATTVSTGDWRLRKPDPQAVRLFFGFRGPRRAVLGVVFSGEVAETGSEVTSFKKGDEVFGSTGMRLGAYAEYLALSAKGVVAPKPPGMTHEEAASVPFGALTALHFLRKAAVKPGEKVLVYGASGAVGTAAVQIARALDADVTGVSSAANLELVRSLGASKVIDYTREPVYGDGTKYDVVFETVGKLPFSTCRQLLEKNGRLLLASAGPWEMMQGLWMSLTSKRNVFSGVTDESAEALKFLTGLIEAGKFKAVIDRVYPLEKTAEGHAYAETGRKKGNIVITVA